MEFYPIITWELFYSKHYCCQQWLPDPNIVNVLIHDNDWHHIAFWMGKAMVNRNSLKYVQQLYLPGMECHWVFVFLPSLPGMGKAELPGTHIGWMVLPIQTLPNSPLHWWKIVCPYLYCCCCPIVLMITLSSWIPPALLWWNTQRGENNSRLTPLDIQNFQSSLVQIFK